MDHWFDDFTKELAQGSWSRRALLASALKAGVAAAGAALLGRSGSLVRISLANGDPQSDERLCSARQEGRVRILTLSAKTVHNGKEVIYEQTNRKEFPRGPATISKIIRLGGNPLLQIETALAAGVTNVNINCGSDIKGIRRATYTSTDGILISGAIDGRRIQPFRVGDKPGSIKFADNGPPLQVQVDTDIREALRLILEEAKKSSESCASTSTSVRQAHHSLTAPPAVAQGEDGHGSNPQTSGLCIACEAACTTVATACGITAGIACAASFGLACGALAACGVAEVACMEACHATGAPCCPVSCGDVACCDRAETCLNANIGICCSKGLVGCASKHCCKPSDTCINATGFCCPKENVVCNHACCKTGEVCKDGVTCCPPGNVVCKGVCCKNGEECKAGICCQPAHVVCKGVCCKKNEVCVNEKCCDENLACGKVCCAENNRCVDKQKGICCLFAVADCNGICCKLGEKCINGKCCPNPCGDKCCGATEGCSDGNCVSLNCPSGQATCISKDAPDKFGAALCCPKNTSCCLGKCCKPGEACCVGAGHPFGCHPVGACIA
jgi:hypothetical protein